MPGAGSDDGVAAPLPGPVVDTGPKRDCLECRLSGAACFSIAGGYTLWERRLVGMRACLLIGLLIDLVDLLTRRSLTCYLRLCFPVSPSLPPVHVNFLPHR